MTVDMRLGTSYEVTTAAYFAIIMWYVVRRLRLSELR